MCFMNAQSHRLSTGGNGNDYMWFMNALKGQQLLAQGNALGKAHTQSRRPVRAKAFKLPTITKLLPLQGALLIVILTQGVALG